MLAVVANGKISLFFMAEKYHIYIYIYLSIYLSTHIKGNDNPLQYSCLENPMDRGAWWAKRVGHDLVTKSLYIYIHTHIYIYISVCEQ